uniref:Uncharacterized protein n=1 Tax=viral metagenome TaxID=1070528 RepID=A0A6C0J919_9ZZZZ
MDILVLQITPPPDYDCYDRRIPSNVPPGTYVTRKQLIDYIKDKIVKTVKVTKVTKVIKVTKPIKPLKPIKPIKTIIHV